MPAVRHPVAGPLAEKVRESVLGTWLRAAHSALLGNMPVLAAGTALFGILATIPALAAVVSIYGLAADPHQIESHLRGLDTVLPHAVVDFLISELGRQAGRSTGELGVTIATSAVLALYSARGAANALIGGLNTAYRVRERRGPIRRQLTSLALAGSTIVGLMILASVVVALPAFLALFRIGDDGERLAGALRWPILFVATLGAQAALYWVAPSPREFTRRHTWPGALVGTALWLLSSWGLSMWVDHVANYQLFYGAFASVIVTLLWFYFSVLAILIGGFVNAELERRDGAPPPSHSVF
jgi:membrane protein